MNYGPHKHQGSIHLSVKHQKKVLVIRKQDNNVYQIYNTIPDSKEDTPWTEQTCKNNTCRQFQQLRVFLE
jgi:hypothetical protein